MESWSRLKSFQKGRSYIDDNLISNAIDVIASSCSTTAWTMKCFDIRSEKIVRVKDRKINGDNTEIAYLPALHRNISRAEIYNQLSSLYPSCTDRIKETTFYKIAKTVTKTQSKNLRAIDYHITDLLHEPKNRLKGVISDLYDDCQGDIRASLLTHIDQVNGAIQHQYPLLL